MTRVIGSLDNYFGPGIYQHFKGKFYFVLGLSMDCDDPSAIKVVYRPLYNIPEWAGFIHKSLTVFNEQVEYEGKAMPRFVSIAAMP